MQIAIITFVRSVSKPKNVAQPLVGDGKRQVLVDLDVHIALKRAQIDHLQATGNKITAGALIAELFRSAGYLPGKPAAEKPAR